MSKQKIQGTACTAGTYVHHAFAALQYGQWHEAERLMVKASRLIEREVAPVDPDPRFVVLSAVAGFEFWGCTFPVLFADVVAKVGPVDPYLLAELTALVAQLTESAGEPESWVAWLNEEIDSTLSDMLMKKENHNA